MGKNYILVTGGAGYIGSHAVRALAQAGFLPVTLDNLSEGHREAVLEGELVVGQLGDQRLVSQLLERYPVQAVMHFASRCYVGESMENPRLYYEHNVVEGIRFLEVLLRFGIKRFIFSSSCATYGNPVQIPIPEEHPCDPINPYGETKYFLERILKQYDRAYGLRSVSLRYFNAAGASRDALLGEAHQPETHIIPRLLAAAAGQLPGVDLYGEDYPTRDGTCVRDYIHVEDLAEAHLAALRYLLEGGPSAVFNLGTGQGFTVREVVHMCRRVTGREISVRVRPRRPGDPPELVADPARARQVLQWEAACSDLETIVRTAWRWEQRRRY